MSEVPKSDKILHGEMDPSVAKHRRKRRLLKLGKEAQRDTEI